VSFNRLLPTPCHQRQGCVGSSLVRSTLVNSARARSAMELIGAESKSIQTGEGVAAFRLNRRGSTREDGCIHS
jgi:hypothetical protein